MHANLRGVVIWADSATDFLFQQLNSLLQIHKKAVTDELKENTTESLTINYVQQKNKSQAH